MQERVRRRHQLGQGPERGHDHGGPESGEATPNWSSRLQAGATAHRGSLPAAALLSSLGSAIADSGSALMQTLIRVASPAGARRSSLASAETPTASSTRQHRTRAAFSRLGSTESVPLSTPAKGGKDD